MGACLSAWKGAGAVLAVSTAVAKGVRRPVRWALLMVALASIQASAQPPRVLPHEAHGLFTGDDWRFRRESVFSGLALRIVADLVAIPSGAPWWGANDWLLFGAAVGSTVGLSVGTPSLDVRFQQLVQYQLLGGPEHFTIWNKTGDLIIWSAVGATTLGLLLYGLFAGDDAAAETATLMVEAFAVAQLHHNMLKLLTGRAGPRRTELAGHYFGPEGGVKFWPAGTPSGHMASMYALLSVVMHMVDHPALWVGLHAFAFVFGASLVGDNYHWLSDVTLGAAIGFCVGRWVVQHRSTHFVYGHDEKPTVKVNLAPLVLPGTGGGLGLVGTY